MTATNAGGRGKLRSDFVCCRRPRSDRVRRAQRGNAVPRAADVLRVTAQESLATAGDRRRAGVVEAALERPSYDQTQTNLEALKRSV